MNSSINWIAVAVVGAVVLALFVGFHLASGRLTKAVLLVVLALVVFIVIVNVLATLR